MRILNISAINWAGAPTRLSEAINRHTEHESRAVCMKRHKWRYPTDIISSNPKELRHWIEWADVVNCWAKYDPLDIAGVPMPKNLIITHIGGWFWRQPARHRRWAKQRGVKKEFGTSLSFNSYRRLEWMPPPLPVDDWRLLKRTHAGKPIVCQAPSKRKRKNTAEIVEKLAGMKDIDFRIIENVSWDECMSRKAEVDIYIGLFGDYGSAFGQSGLEAMCMKIPVIGYSPGHAAEARRLGSVPFYESELDNLPNAVSALISSRELYNEYAERGHAFVKRFHDCPVVARRFVSFCEEICNVAN